MREGDSWIDRRVSPSFLFVSGLLLAPAIILQQNLVVKAVQTVLFLFLAEISISRGRRRLFIGSLIFITTTIIVNLFSPVGRVMLELGPVPITRGALRVGISKATTLASLLCLSRFCVRPSVRLPGTVGRYVSQTLAYLNILLARGERVCRQNLVRRLDEVFDNICENERLFNVYFQKTRNTLVGVTALTFLLIVNWASVFFSFSTLLGEG